MNVLKSQLQALVDFFTIKTALIHQLFIIGEHPFSSFSPWGWGKKEENGFRKRMFYFKIIFFLLFLVSNSSAFSQTYSDTSWQRWYGEPNRHENPWFYRNSIHYDQGILYLQHIDQNPYACILQKTDVNGYLLWSKYFSASVQIYVIAHNVGQDGSIYLGGGFMRSNGVITNPIIIKLNACGELEWCKRIYIDELHTSNLLDVAVDNNGDIIWLIKNTSDLNSACQILKTTSNGDVLWYNNFVKKDDYPSMNNNQILYLNIGPQNDYYLTGYTTFPDNYEPDEWLRYRATAVKINEEGKEEWMSPVGVYDGIGSLRAQLLTFESNGDIWSIMVADSAGGSQSGRFTFNADGEILDYYFQPVLEGITVYNEFTMRRKIQNNLNAARFDYFLDPNSNIYNWGLIVFDNDFNVISYKLDMDDYADSPFSTIMSHDSLLLDISSCYNCNGSQYSDVYLAKYNADLSFADTIDDTTWEYDYFCDDPIVSDTIYLACDPIGIEELHPLVDKAKDELPLQISVNPNPAKNQAKLQWEYLTPSEESNELSLQIFDIKGNEMYQEQLNRGDYETEIKTRKWQSGLYIVIMRSEGIMAGNAKFVIEK